jgi:hypothetical protein
VDGVSEVPTAEVDADVEIGRTLREAVVIEANVRVKKIV